MAEGKPPSKRATKGAKTKGDGPSNETAPPSETPPRPKGRYRRKKWLKALGPRARAYAEREDIPPPPPAESETIAKVEYIANELARGRWDGYVSRYPLAVAWGISDSRVQQIAAEAHRLVAYDPQQREEKRRALAAFVAGIRSEASSRCNVVTGLPDFAAALKAAELEAKFVGIEFEETRAPGEVAMRIVVEGEEQAPAEEQAPSDEFLGR